MNGNRTLSGYVTGAGNRLTTDGSYNYTYDNEGNMLTRTRISDGELTEFTWDHRNRLTKIVVKNSGGTVIKEERYTYDINNLRIGVWVDPDGAGPQTATQTWTLYDGPNPYADFNGSGSLTYRYLYGPGIDFLFGRKPSSGSAAWYLRDIIGSVRIIADAGTGTVLNQLTYDSYGSNLTESNPANGDRHGWAGMERTGVSGFNYQMNRYYVSTVGRWGSEDPIWPDDHVNPLVYVGNNPVSRRDPTGLRELSLEVVPKIPEHNRGGKPNKEKGDGSDPGISLSHVISDNVAARPARPAGFGPSPKVQPVSVEDMVTQIKDKVMEFPQVGERNCIKKLTIRCHGSSGSVWIGNGNAQGTEYIDANIKPGSQTYDPRIVKLLAELRPLFCKDAKIVIWSCNVGQDEDFLQALADVTGATVEALDCSPDEWLFTLGWAGDWQSRPPRPGAFGGGSSGGGGATGDF